MRLNGVQILGMQRNKVTCFVSSPCVITMQGLRSETADRSQLSSLAIQENCDIVVAKGRIVAMGRNAAAPYWRETTGTAPVGSLSGALGGAPDSSDEVVVVDASKLTLMPGLIDCHTHPIFDGSRAKETVLKSQGLSYEEISARGGGIAFSTKKTREASNAQLQESLQLRAQKSLSLGVVLLECKTGYGLSPAEELRHLTVIEKTILDTAANELPFPMLAPTLLGPHAASPDYHGLEAYIQALIAHMPQFSKVTHALSQAGKCLPLAADVFVERNYFTPEQADKWLCAALQLGLDVHIHSDEFSRSGGCELAVALAKRQEQTHLHRRKSGRVLSADHCQYATDGDLSKLHNHGVAAVALPVTSFFSNIPFIDAMKWRSSGVRAAIASDFNPGSAPLNNLWFAAYLALTRCGFTVAEVLAGITYQAAYALGAEEHYGTLQVGGLANIEAFEGTEPEDFFASPLGDHLRFVSLS